MTTSVPPSEFSEDQIFDLLRCQEGTTVDFKAVNYDLSVESKRFDFVKDVISMANTPRQSVSHIVLGVKKHLDGSYDVLGLDSDVDDADLQSQFTERIYPCPRFSYGVFPYQGKRIGIISIPPERIGPCVPIKTLRVDLGRGQLCFRRGSKNEIAVGADVLEIMLWFNGNRKEVPEFPLEPDTSWQQFAKAVHNLDRSRSYILLASPLVEQLNTDLAALGKIPWLGAFDFDPESQRSGLLSIVSTELVTHRSLHLTVIHQRPSQLLHNATYWFLARGLAGRAETLETGSWRDWQKRYLPELTEQFKALASASNPSPLTCIIFWTDPDLLNHLESSLQLVNGYFGDAADFVIITTPQRKNLLEPIALKYEAVLLDIPLHHVCSGVNSLCGPSLQSPGSDNSFSFPSSSGTPLEMPDRAWLEEELEMVHLNAGLRPASGDPLGSSFLRGAEITWYELGIHSDVDRDHYEKLSRHITEALTKRHTRSFVLYHAPGAGGSTIARRLLWDYHRRFPCVVLHSVSRGITSERIAKVVAWTGLPSFILVDSSEVTDSSIDDLFSELSSRLVPSVILQVLRRFTARDDSSHRIAFVPSELSVPEAHRFVDIYARERPDKRADLDTILNDRHRRTAFYFALETFGKNFSGLSRYVSSRISDLEPVQKKILGFLAMAHHFAQKPLPAQAFAFLLHLPKNRTVRLDAALTGPAMDLLVQPSEALWRTAHDLIAKEILVQLLSPPPADSRLWHQNLSFWAKDFVRFCRGDDAVPSEYLLGVAQRTFLYRDNTDFLGTEKSANQSFSQLIEDIRSLDGALEVLRTVAETYPDQAHFWAHLARFLSSKLRQHDQALEAIDRAITIQPNDHLLHHMKGVTIRNYMKDLIQQNVPLEKVVMFAKGASDSFETSRKLNPENLHAYISDVETITALLEYVAKQHTQLSRYLTSGQADPYVCEQMQVAEDLLDQVRRCREGEPPDSFEESCRANLNVLYGQYDKALQSWDQLLGSKQLYVPPIRRSIVWTYLARQGRSWDQLPQKDIQRITELLEENLIQEPDNDKNFRLWIQAIRRLRNPPSLDAIIERVSYWRSNSGSLDATYYLYVLTVVKALEGFVLAGDNAAVLIAESSKMSYYRKNRTKSFEWLGAGQGIHRILHQSLLGEWDKEFGFWKRTESLARMQGVITENIEGPQSGEIELAPGLKAFFPPAKYGFSKGKSENQEVSFYLGFSYAGLRAWDVKPLRN